MMRMVHLRLYFLFILFVVGCKKGNENNPEPQPVIPTSFSFAALRVDGGFSGFNYYNVTSQPTIKLSFSAPIDQTSVAKNIVIKDNSGALIGFTPSFENNDSTVLIKPSLKFITQYTLSVNTELQARNKGKLQTPVSIKLTTAIDSADKFPRITDEELLTLVQRQTFKYFWDFAHPESGMARERNTSGDIVTTGGSGFGVMAIITGVHRNFISRAEGLSRLQKIVGFLKNRAQRFHGAFPHWLNGNTGQVQPFSAKDNGADLVETSLLMQGLLTARQYFSGGDAAETSLRGDINELWNEVEWSWFRKNNENVLYWHWSPNFGWEMNHPIRGWNEALITYVLAASSPTHAIPGEVYHKGWANNGSIRNGNSFYDVQLPLGPNNGGPLFFSHYSFLGINPVGLKDVYADYGIQTKAHSLVNYNYCKANPKQYNGYSGDCWGLTASDDNKVGYLAHDPNNDNGVISPTAALSSFPYTPAESMKALKFFYYKLGDKVWKEYGFVDAFNLNDVWFANSFLAIDQGPIIIMIENHRSGLLWDLFMSCPEVKTGMRNLEFQGPNL